MYGSPGTVIEIVYDRGPLDGDLPEYVIVEFPGYCGPPWMETEPKWVPIPTVQRLCDQKSCQRCVMEFVPLALAYGYTLHSFQGMNVGKCSNIPYIIGEPGNRGFEGINPGIFYTLLSRATHIGSKDDRTKSAIFLDGPNMTGDRIRDLTHSLNGGKGRGKEYEKVAKRRKWVEYLTKHIITIQLSEADKNTLIEWATQSEINPKQVRCIIDWVNWRTTHSVNY